MTFGLLAGGPLRMLFSMLLMQGLSLTMWRTFLNQAIPRFDPLRFSINLGNNPNQLSSTTTTTSAPVLDHRILLPYLQLISQQKQPQQPSVGQQNGVQMQAMPHVIVVQPQMATTSRSSASTRFSVQVEPPQQDSDYEQDFEPQSKQYSKRMSTPLKTTTAMPDNMEKVTSRISVSGILVHVSPRAQSGVRKFVITNNEKKSLSEEKEREIEKEKVIDLEQKSVNPLFLLFPNNSSSVDLMAKNRNETNSDETENQVLDKNEENDDREGLLKNHNFDKQ